MKAPGQIGMSKVSNRFKTQGPYQSDFDPNMADIQEFINNQTYMRGDNLTTPNGTSQDFPVQVDGTARFFWGIVFYSDDYLDLVTLTINREKVINAVPVVFLTPDLNIKFGLFYAVPRPLNGNDTVTLTVKSDSSHTLSYCIWLSDTRPAASGLPTK